MVQLKNSLRFLFTSPIMAGFFIGLPRPISVLFKYHLTKMKGPIGLSRTQPQNCLSKRKCESVVNKSLIRAVKVSFLEPKCEFTATDLFWQKCWYDRLTKLKFLF